MACGAPVLTTPRLSLPEVGGDAVAYTGQDPDRIAKDLAALLDDEPRRLALAAGRAGPGQGVHLGLQRRGAPRRVGPRGRDTAERECPAAGHVESACSDSRPVAGGRA